MNDSLEIIEDLIKEDKKLASHLEASALKEKKKLEAALEAECATLGSGSHSEVVLQPLMEELRGIESQISLYQRLKDTSKSQYVPSLSKGRLQQSGKKQRYSSQKQTTQSGNKNGINSQNSELAKSRSVSPILTRSSDLYKPSSNNRSCEDEKVESDAPWKRAKSRPRRIPNQELRKAEGTDNKREKLFTIRPTRGQEVTVSSAFERSLEKAHKDYLNDQKKNKEAELKITSRLRSRFSEDLDDKVVQEGFVKSPQHQRNQFSDYSTENEYELEKLEHRAKLLKDAISARENTIGTDGDGNVEKPEAEVQINEKSHNENLASHSEADEDRRVLKDYTSAISKENSKTVDRVASSLESDTKEKMKVIRADMLRMREEKLNGMLLQHERDMEEREVALRRELEVETVDMMERLKNELEDEKRRKMEDIRAEIKRERKKLSSRLISQAKEELKSEKERKWNALLEQHETKLEERKAELRHQSEETSREKTEKLTAALALGASKKLRELQSRLEEDYNRKEDEIRHEAHLNLVEREKELRTELKESHEESLDQLREMLKRQHEMKISNVRMEMEAKSAQELRATELKIVEEKEASFQRVNAEYKCEYDQRVKKLEQKLSMDMEYDIASLEHSMKLQLDQNIEEFIAKKKAEHKSLLQKAKEGLEEEFNGFLKVYSQIVSPVKDNFKEIVPPTKRSIHRQFSDYSQLEAIHEELDRKLKANSRSKTGVITLTRAFCLRMHAHILNFVDHFHEMYTQHGPLMHRVGMLAKESLALKKEIMQQKDQVERVFQECNLGREREEHLTSTCRRLFTANEALIKAVQEKRSAVTPAAEKEENCSSSSSSSSVAVRNDE